MPAMSSHILWLKYQGTGSITASPGAARVVIGGAEGLVAAGGDRDLVGADLAAVEGGPAPGDLGAEGGEAEDRAVEVDGRGRCGGCRPSPRRRGSGGGSTGAAWLRLISGRSGGKSTPWSQRRASMTGGGAVRWMSGLKGGMGWASGWRLMGAALQEGRRGRKPGGSGISGAEGPRAPARLAGTRVPLAAPPRPRAAQAGGHGRAARLPQGACPGPLTKPFRGDGPARSGLPPRRETICNGGRQGRRARPVRIWRRDMFNNIGPTGLLLVAIVVLVLFGRGKVAG